MCIRDRVYRVNAATGAYSQYADGLITPTGIALDGAGNLYICLLYTSDAADERSSVDLGGRRIIKKKQQIMRSSVRMTDTAQSHRAHTQIQILRLQ